MCPLCGSPKTNHYFEDRHRQYKHCQSCELVFVAPEFLPSIEREKREYDLHQNAFNDQGYIRFLSSSLKAGLASSKHKPIKKGLDFGCGPSPVLAAMLAKYCNHVAFYDPIYFANQSVLLSKYDLITCTEAMEHFHTPRKEWQLFMNMLADDGSLVIKTKRVVSVEKFANWHYKNDVTHVSFFSEATFEFLAQQEKLAISFPANDIVVFSSNT